MTPFWRATVAALPPAGEFPIDHIRFTRVRDSLTLRRRWVEPLRRHNGVHWLYRWTPLGAAVRAAVAASEDAG